MKLQFLVLIFTFFLIDSAVLAQPTELPEGFKGDSYSAVMKAISDGKVLQKDEFETTEEHTIRVQKFLKETKIGDHSINDTVFVVTPKCTYDADNKKYNCTVFEMPEDIEFNDSNEKDPLSKLLLPQVSWEVYRNGFWWTYSTDPASAKAVKTDLRFAIYGFPKSVDRLGTVVMVSSRAVFFNQKTGQVYLRWTDRSKSGYKLPRMTQVDW